MSDLLILGSDGPPGVWMQAKDKSSQDRLKDRRSVGNQVADKAGDDVANAVHDGNPLTEE